MFSSGINKLKKKMGTELSGITHTHTRMYIHTKKTDRRFAQWQRYVTAKLSHSKPYTTGLNEDA